ncbi:MULTISPECIES: CHAD domain-containing protein [Luteimonas]|uniref:CHAD domain-containing protein n=1 Tax=Luteimonas TaxID=83614 RepID=UPI001303F523|nr:MULTISPECIES: CHAD domain-containing protein [Luteimonas]
MPYRIRHRDSDPQAAVRRIAREQVEAALQGIDRHDADTAPVIHDVRKRCKKVRGLLRLVRPGLATYRLENAAFRNIAAPLGPLRDAGVRVDTFDALVAPLDARDAASLVPIRNRLRLERDTLAAAQVPDALLRDAREALQAALARIATWRLEDDGFDAFAGGLRTTYRRGRKAMRRARRTGDDEAFHDWRKRCKAHAFHLRLLRPLWPGPMRAQRACAEALGELLGEHHDLAVLASCVRAMRELPRDAVDTLLARIRERQHALARRADAIGARLYAESPSALAHTWRRRYKAWRRDR